VKSVHRISWDEGYGSSLSISTSDLASIATYNASSDGEVVVVVVTMVVTIYGKITTCE
jgi:hypothetical protein